VSCAASPSTAKMKKEPASFLRGEVISMRRFYTF
jgi:hypothetical protein